MATTSEQVADMYNQQVVISKNNAANQSTGVDDDFEYWKMINIWIHNISIISLFYFFFLIFHLLYFC